MRQGRIAVDGASKGNPGPAGIGVVIAEESGKVIREFGEYIGLQTNNSAEYMALERALTEAFSMGFTHLAVQTDSELMAKQINGQYQVKNGNIRPLYDSVCSLIRKFASVSITHVLREKNKAADKLASAAAKGGTTPSQPVLLLDETPTPSPAPAKEEAPVREETSSSVKRISVSTSSRSQLVDITRDVRAAVEDSGVRDGLCVVYVPHTTAGVTINENADPDVMRDIISTLDRLVPADPSYRHVEGNSDAHVKASMMGSSVTVLVEGGKLLLGTWQGIYFAEFDGPRKRQVYIRVA